MSSRLIAVVGDVILDKTTTVNVRGLSPENCNTLVVRPQETTFNLGGAANVAANVHALGGHVRLVAPTADPRLAGNWHNKTNELVDKAGFPWHATPTPGWNIPLKHRIVSASGPLLRIDDETVRGLDSAGRFTITRNAAVHNGVVVLVNYGKGAFSDPAFVDLLVCQAVGNNCTVLADPGRDGNWLPYGSSRTFFKANLSQVRQFYEANANKLGGESSAPYDPRHFDPAVVHSQPQYANIARNALACLKACGVLCAGLIVTLGPGGAVLILPDGSPVVYQGRVAYPADPCGAGDSFLAGVAVRMAQSATPAIHEATEYGNKVAGVAVQHQGVCVVRKEEVPA